MVDMSRRDAIGATLDAGEIAGVTTGPRMQAPQRSILITGCSSGIGYHCARALHAHGGWRVFATDAASRRTPTASPARGWNRCAST
jgi:NADPH:quinone reductase-like Zn-dependent oxidoreductase